MAHDAERPGPDHADRAPGAPVDGPCLMSLTFAQFKAGIKQVESGGRYSVVNSIGAVGAYQVMKSNIPEWTRRALGYSMTWQQFRDSPSAQEKVADVILGGYFKQ